MISSRVLCGNDLLHMYNGFDIFVAGKSICGEKFAIADDSILLDREEEDREEEIKAGHIGLGGSGWAP